MDFDAEFVKIRKRFEGLEAKLGPKAAMILPSNLAAFEQRLLAVESVMRQVPPLVEQLVSLVEEVVAIKNQLAGAPVISDAPIDSQPTTVSS